MSSSYQETKAITKKWINNNSTPISSNKIKQLNENIL